MEMNEQCADCAVELVYQETLTQEMLHCPACEKRYRLDEFFNNK